MAGAGMVGIVRRTRRKTTRTEVLAIGINGGRIMLVTRLVTWSQGLFSAVTFIHRHLGVGRASV